LAYLKKDILEVGKRLKKKLINAFYYALTVIEKFMLEFCSFHRRLWLKNWVNSGNPNPAKLVWQP